MLKSYKLKKEKKMDTFCKVKLQIILCLSNILDSNYRNCKPSKCKNRLPLNLNMISQYDTQVKYSEGIYDPVLHLI